MQVIGLMNDITKNKPGLDGRGTSKGFLFSTGRRVVPGKLPDIVSISHLNLKYNDQRSKVYVRGMRYAPCVSRDNLVMEAT